MTTPTDSATSLIRPLELNLPNDRRTQVVCQCDDENLTLTGSVERFHHLQLVIEKAKKVAHGRKITLRVTVTGTPEEFSADVDHDDHAELCRGLV